MGYDPDDASSNDVASFAGRAIGCWRTRSQCAGGPIYYDRACMQGALSITLITSLYAKCIQVGLYIYIHTYEKKQL